jgi:hypothetical protein
VGFSWLALQPFIELGLSDCQSVLFSYVAEQVEIVNTGKQLPARSQPSPVLMAGIDVPV